jgi:hypothetical protein
MSQRCTAKTRNGKKCGAWAITGQTKCAHVDDVKTIDSVEIGWPSGAVDTLKDLAADKFYAVLEGRGAVPAEQIKPLAPKP